MIKFTKCYADQVKIYARQKRFKSYKTKGNDTVCVILQKYKSSLHTLRINYAIINCKILK